MPWRNEHIMRIDFKEGRKMNYGHLFLIRAVRAHIIVFLKMVYWEYTYTITSPFSWFLQTDLHFVNEVCSQ